MRILVSMRKALIAGNWKLNKNITETKEFIDEFLKLYNPNSQEDYQAAGIEAMLIPTFTSLSAAAKKLSETGIELGAQDLSEHGSGAFTGEVSAEMLSEVGVSTVLVGHSERREIFKENDSVINAKLKRALGSGLKAILCCGESLETREVDGTDDWISKQIELALEDINEIENWSEIENSLSEKLSIAYEPIWAIGTGKTCESPEANRVIKNIRSKLESVLAPLSKEGVADEIKILYGGSVRPNTIEEQMKESDIDGALVGGASLKPEDFSNIIKGALEARSTCTGG